MAKESRPTKSTAAILLAMLAIQVFVVGLAVAGTLRYGSLWPFAIAIPVVGLVAFTAIYLDTRRLRHAIGAAVILVYIAMLGFSINSRLSDQVAANPFLRDMFTDFRTLVATVAAFYFTADVAERVLTKDQPKQEGDSAPRADG